MTNKNIIFTAPGIAEVIEKDVPSPGPGEVLIRILRTTISSGTEKANLIGDANVAPTAAPRVSFPRQVGYSASGVVEAIGENVTSVSVGDRVMAAWTKHAQYCVRPEKNVYRLPDSISFDEAAMVHIATFPMAALRKCHVEIGESAMVMGLGVLGLVGVQLLHLAGAVPVIAVDPVESKRELALRLGADYALDPFEEGFADRVKELTNGGANAVIEVTGLGSGLDMALDATAQFGRLALLGCTRNSDFSIDYYRKVHARGITMIGAHTNARPKNDSSNGWWTERDDTVALLQLIHHGRLNLKQLIEEVHSPAEAPAVYERLATAKSFPVVQFDWEKL